MDVLNKAIHDKFSNVLDWHYNNKERNSVVITFTDGSEAVYSVFDILDDVRENTCSSDEETKVFESLTEKDIEDLSHFDLTEEEIMHILSLFEIVPEDDKDQAFSIIKSLFLGKKLVPVEKNEEDIAKDDETKNSKISESYTRKLLGDI